MSSVDEPITGRVWKFGDSVDTNQLAGGGLTGATKEETLRINCLRGLRPDFTDGVQPGDLLVAGANLYRAGGIAAVIRTRLAEAGFAVPAT